ncbi:LuxR C-terminal-related transcriptional regulator [Faecalibacter bovis]|uniref:PAS domain-containing protein n=1 Tax=Faecalibacter bovis TaxID=2898187 RepID=A0ABX7XBY3_9FLAO|nr:LuxR C-terminal-related transcriptional regulator [Faecalibacter bovis]QTV05412.1 PAS domain-containing protein [Faecalibacter bovis]
MLIIQNMINHKTKAEWDFWFKHPNNIDTVPTKKPKINPSYYFIFNCLTNEILYTSESFKEILGYDKEDYTFLEIIEFLHADDYNYVMECERKAINFNLSLSEREQFRFVVTYTYRTRILSGQYIRVKQSYHALDVNENGNMTRALVFHELINYNEERSSDDFKIFDRQTNKFVQIENKYNLTKRENQIYDLVREGFTSHEISTKLHLSKHTVDTHRKNILSKTNSRNFMTLVKEEIIL